MPKKKPEPRPARPGWQNRIVGHGEKPAKEFNFHPENWKDHPENQKSALNEILTKIGWVMGVIENRRTGKLIDGHARIDEALAQDEDRLIPFTEVDLSEDEERLILAVLDPLGSLAQTDAGRLSELVESLNLESENLLSVFAGMINLPEDIVSDETPNLNAPEFNYQNRFGVIVECADEPEQERVYEKLRVEGYSVKVVVV